MGTIRAAWLFLEGRQLNLDRQIRVTFRNVRVVVKHDTNKVIVRFLAKSDVERMRNVVSIEIVDNGQSFSKLCS